MLSVVNESCDCSEGRMDQPAESGPGCQDVNPHFLQQLRELDIPEEAAKQVIWCLQDGYIHRSFRATNADKTNVYYT